MGLDIYFHKTKTSVAPSFRNNESIETFVKENRELKKSTIPTNTINTINELVENASVEAREQLVETIKPYCVYEFYLEDIKTCEKEKLAKLVDYIIEGYCDAYDMYYRKVNFLYAFFAEALTDEQCVVTKHDVETIISHCKEVLADHSLAEKLLPTQSGFFFGSTDYNEWYFKDVEYVLEQFTKYLEGWDDDTIGWVYFSW